jgi:hypothetical protein
MPNNSTRISIIALKIERIITEDEKISDKFF